jgi:hypothetical protein
MSGCAEGQDRRPRNTEHGRGIVIAALASRGAGLLIRRDASASRRPSVAPSARSRECDGWGLRPRRWDVGGLPRGVESRFRAPRGAMGAVPGTFSRRKEGQAPCPRAVHAMLGRPVIVGTMPCPARPGARQKLRGICCARVPRALSLIAVAAAVRWLL